jgi:LPXTG-site transpeptidase (sortase) family protein
MGTAPPSAPPPRLPRDGPRRASPPPRSRAPICLALVLAGLFAVAIGAGQAFDLHLPDLSGLWPGNESSTGPTRITIPAVQVRARVVAVGQADDGSIAVPTQDPVTTAGWYDKGPNPGDAGTAVIVGHVDTKTSTAVFYRLTDLARGDRIQVTRRDGRVATFAVDSVSRVPKNAFPSATIFAPSTKPRLVLVTCGGDWVGGALGYADNVIVYATAVS